MTLADLQRQFLGEITAPDDSDVASVFPPEIQAGLAVYRNGYRARLLEAIKASFPRVRALVGEEGFAAAAAHHLILHPPSRWSLDEVGHGFDAALATLFADDPDVAELAWLEWEMQQLFVAADEVALDPLQFAQRVEQFRDPDWQRLRLEPITALRMRLVRSDCAARWQGQAQTSHELIPALARFLIVWRKGQEPRFRILKTDEAEALQHMQAGGSFGEMCDTLVSRSGSVGIELAGGFLGQWVEHGLIKGIR